MTFCHFTSVILSFNDLDMTNQQLCEYLETLRLTPAEAAQLLGVSTRSIQRWIEGEEVPGPAAAALKAWRTLDERRLPWMPDSDSIFSDDQSQIQLHNRHSEELAELIRQVDARGGVKTRWTVDIQKCRATFGPFLVTFYKLQSGSFSPGNCRRLDTPFDRDRDRAMIEDAYYCIAKAISKIPAIHSALSDVAKYIRDHSTMFAVKGPALLTAEKSVQHQRLVEVQADKIDGLAESSLEGAATYAQFEAILTELHRLGFFPDMALVSRVAQNMA